MHGNDVDIVDLLALVPSDDDERGSVGATHRRDAGWIYGGQLLGQAVMAAGRSVQGKRPHSMHAYFLRAGSLEAPVGYRVHALRDGRSFSQRRVEASQGGGQIFGAGISFHTVEPGASHQVDAPVGVPDPDGLDPSFEDHYLSGLEASFDIRRVPESALGEPGTARRAVWLRATSTVPDDDLFHYSALAYLSDFELFLSALQRHSLERRPGVMATSLDHALWWHAPVRVDEWLLYVRESPRTGGGRGLTRGQFYTQGGTLIASTAQEGLMRVPKHQ